MEGENRSRVSHLGIEVDSRKEVQGWKERLEAHGLLDREEIEENCCYARQDKVWFHDPDGNDWEVFYVHEQLPITPKDPEQIKSCCA